MAITIANLKRWLKMLEGKSVLHVNQDIGENISRKEIYGYYNNLTEKVIKQPELLDNNELPKLELDDKNKVIFPVAIFQYGLGAYDLYIKTKNEKYLRKFRQCADWAYVNQEISGAWNNFFYIYPDNPNGAMCQGEGASLLIRAYIISKNYDYLNAAKKAIDFMLIKIESGGTSLEVNNGLAFLEYTHRPIVFNGWVFALFGLFDLSIVLCGEEKYSKAFKVSIDLLKQKLTEWDCGFWSVYDLGGKIASPFYHNLHIALLQALYIISCDDAFNEYAKKFINYKNNVFCKVKSFIIKVYQKILE